MEERPLGSRTAGRGCAGHRARLGGVGQAGHKHEGGGGGKQGHQWLPTKQPLTSTLGQAALSSQSSVHTRVFPVFLYSAELILKFLTWGLSMVSERTRKSSSFI